MADNSIEVTTFTVDRTSFEPNPAVYKTQLTVYFTYHQV